MKKFIFYILLIFFVNQTFAQKQKVKYLTTFDDKTIHFGFTLGINMLDFNVVNFNPIGYDLVERPNGNPDFVYQEWPFDPVQIVDTSYVRSDVASIVPGFTVGIVTDLRLSRDFTLRFLPGMSFGERKLTYNIPVRDINDIAPSQLQSYSIKSTFLDFPLLLKYKANRINNNRPYIVFGTAFRQDISRTGKEDLVKLKSGGFYAEVGAGWDLYFPFFRFSLEAKFSFGLTDQLGIAPTQNQRQYYTQSIENLKSNIFTLSFHFE